MFTKTGLTKHPLASTDQTLVLSDLVSCVRQEIRPCVNKTTFSECLKPSVPGSLSFLTESSSSSSLTTTN